MSQTSPSSPNCRARVALRACASLLLLGAIVCLLGPRRYLDILRSASLGPFLIAVALAVAELLLRILRWRFLATRGVPAVTWSQAARSTLAGCRAALTANAWRARLESAEALNGENRVGLGGLALLDIILDVVVAGTAIALNIFDFNGLAVAGFSLVLLLSLIEHVRRLQWTTQGLIQRIARGLAKTSVVDLLAALLLAVLNYGCLLLQFSFLMKSFGAGRPDLAVRALPMILLISFFPAGIFGMGAPQIVAALALSGAGLAAEGVVASFLLFFLNHALPWSFACRILASKTHGMRHGQ